MFVQQRDGAEQSNRQQLVAFFEVVPCFERDASCVGHGPPPISQSGLAAGQRTDPGEQRLP